MTFLPISPTRWNYVSCNLRSISKYKLSCLTNATSTFLILYWKVSYYTHTSQYHGFHGFQYHWITVGNLFMSGTIYVYFVLCIKFMPPLFRVKQNLSVLIQRFPNWISSRNRFLKNLNMALSSLFLPVSHFLFFISYLKHFFFFPENFRVHFAFCLKHPHKPLHRMRLMKGKENKVI